MTRPESSQKALPAGKTAAERTRRRRYSTVRLSRAPFARILKDAGASNLISGVVLLAILVILAVAAPLFGSPYAMHANGLTEEGLPLPAGTAGFLLGTDMLGRDLLARSLAGLQATLVIGIAANITSLGLGTAIGLVAGYYRGWLEQFLMRVADIFLSVPAVLSGLAITSIIGQGTFSLIIIVTALYWAWTARLVFGETVGLCSRAYVDAAKVAGVSSLVIVRRHIFPHIAPLLLNIGALNGAAVIIVGSGLSFLGAGIQLPTPELGNMLAEGAESMLFAPHTLFVPFVFIVLAVLAFVLIGDGLGRRGTDEEKISWLSA